MTDKPISDFDNEFDMPVGFGEEDEWIVVNGNLTEDEARSRIFAFMRDLYGLSEEEVTADAYPLQRQKVYYGIATETDDFADEGDECFSLAFDGRIPDRLRDISYSAEVWVVETH